MNSRLRKQPAVTAKHFLAKPNQSQTVQQSEETDAATDADEKTKTTTAQNSAPTLVQTQAAAEQTPVVKHSTDTKTKVSSDKKNDDDTPDPNLVATTTTVANTPVTTTTVRPPRLPTNPWKTPPPAQRPKPSAALDDDSDTVDKPSQSNSKSGSSKKTSQTANSSDATDPNDLAAVAAVSPDLVSTPAATSDDKSQSAATASSLDATSTSGITNLAAPASPTMPHGPHPIVAGAAVPTPPPDAQFAEINNPAIVTAIHGQLMPNGGTMSIQLDPPELGALQVTVKIENGAISASFATSNAQATQLLSHSLGQLKHALETQGVSVDRLHVQQSSSSDTPSNNSSSDKENGKQSASEQNEAQREQQRRELMRRMWRRSAFGRDPLDMVA